MIVIHDLNLAVRYCDKFLFLKDSKVYAYGGLEVMTPETIRNVYGMDAAIINNWNEAVDDEDHVYILGDMIYRNKKEDIRIFETFLDTGDKVCS